MQTAYTFYAVPISMYSAKVRPYLRYKSIPFVEERITREVIERVYYPRTGVRFIPVLVTPGDEALQDSAHIIEFMEERYPEPSVFPETARQLVAAMAFELYGDEWLAAAALHYRWTYMPPEAAKAGFGAFLYPSLPPETAQELAEGDMRYFADLRDAFGLTEETAPVFEAAFDAFALDFERHLKTHPYLFGSRPSVGDFSLMGCIYGHIYSDPYSHEKFAKLTPRVFDWARRMHEPMPGVGDFLADDELPDTLVPMLARIFRELLPCLRESVTAVDAWIAQNPVAYVPRFLGEHELILEEGGKTVRAPRKINGWVQWRLQRLLDVYDTLEGEMKNSVDVMLEAADAPGGLDIPIRHRVERRRNRYVPEGVPKRFAVPTREQAAKLWG